MAGDAAAQLERVLAPVPKRLRPRIRARSVQRALDAVLEIQEPLLKAQRQAHTAQVVDSFRSEATIAS